MKIVYSVEVLRSGQPRAYADTEHEYLITVQSEQYGKTGLHPWLLGGDVEAQIMRDEAMRAARQMHGGDTPTMLRKRQRDWAKSIVAALGRPFREKDDVDGRVGMEAAFYPTLRSLKLDPAAGTIRALIVSEYTD